MATVSTPTLKHFLIQLIKPYKGFVSLIAIVGILWAFINTFLPYTLKLIIDHVVSFQGDKSDLFKSTQPYIFGYIALWIGLCANMRFLDWIRLRLFPNLREDVMTKMFSYLNQHSHQYFQNNFAGSLVNKITDMQSGIINILSTLDDIYSQLLGVSVAIIILLLIHPIFAFILLAWALAFLSISFLFLKPIQQLSHDFAESKTSVVGRMVDSISNILNVRLFARHLNENQYIRQSIKKAVQKDREMQSKIIKMRFCWDISIILLMSLNLFILLRMYSNNLVTVGDFTFVISLSISILWNLWFLASQFVNFSEQIGICRQALSIITKPHEIIDAENARPLVITKGKIQFHNVSFHYAEGTKLFKNKNIVIEGGQKVGLVGFTGSGKSTFVNLILRLFEVMVLPDNTGAYQFWEKTVKNYDKHYQTYDRTVPHFDNEMRRIFRLSSANKSS